MGYFSSEFDIRFIYDLIKLSAILAITPPLDDGNKEKTYNFNYYCFAGITIIIIGCASSLYAIIVYFIPLFKSTTVVLRFVCIIGTSIMSIMTILIALLNADTWNTFMNLFKYIDEKLNKGQVLAERRNFLKMELLFWHFLLFCIFGYDGYVWYSNYGWKLFRFCLFKYVNFYHCMMTTIVVLHFASALRGRFRRINNILIKTNDLHNILKSLIPNIAPADAINNLKSINEVTDYYLLLSELVDMFNKLFGWQIFFMTENLIILLLETLNTLMLGIDYTQVTTDAHHDFRTIFFLTGLCLVLILSHVRVVLFCEDVNNESRNTLTICYNLQQTVDPLSNDRKELIILSEVVNLLKTRTNAAGFYFINRSLISRVFAYLFSYSIVLIQFNKQN